MNLYAVVLAMQRMFYKFYFTSNLLFILEIKQIYYDFVATRPLSRPPFNAPHSDLYR